MCEKCDPHGIRDIKYCKCKNEQGGSNSALSDQFIKPCSLQRGDSIEVTHPMLKEGEVMKAIVFSVNWIENTGEGVKPYWRIRAAGFKGNENRFDVSGNADKYKKAL